jgi:hypothetical protein
LKREEVDEKVARLKIMNGWFGFLKSLMFPL